MNYLQEDHFKAIALDVEGTIIESASRINPRPFLESFLKAIVEKYEKQYIFTVLTEEVWSQTRTSLLEVHPNLSIIERFEYVNWSGDYKDLRNIKEYSLGDILLIDDTEDIVQPRQKHQWVRINSFNGSQNDQELNRISELLSLKVPNQ